MTKKEKKESGGKKEEKKSKEVVDIEVRTHMIGTNIGWTCPVCGIGISPHAWMCGKCVNREKGDQEKYDGMWKYNVESGEREWVKFNTPREKKRAE